MSGDDWARASRVPSEGYDVILVTTAGEHERRLWQARLSARFGAHRVVVVCEPERGGLGSLGGTLEAWDRGVEAAKAAWGLDLASGVRVLMLHNAGSATRSSPLTQAAGNSRGGLPLPCGEASLTLTEAVALQAMPLARSNPGGVVDVVWCSQLFFPSMSPASVPAPRFDIEKLCRPLGVAPPSADDRRDLGVLVADADRRLTAFLPQGHFKTAQTFRAWRATHPDAAHDLGSFRIRVGTLADLAAAWRRSPPSGPRNLDPDLLAPLVHLGTGAAADTARRVEVAALLGALPAVPSVGCCPLGAHMDWYRLRRPSEVHRALLATTGPEGRTLRTFLRLPDPDARGVVAVDACLADGSEVRDSLLWRVSGRVRATGTVLLDVVGRVEASGSLVVRTRGDVGGVDAVAVDAPMAGGVVRLALGLEVDPRDVDGEAVPPNLRSFASVRAEAVDPTAEAVQLQAHVRARLALGASALAPWRRLGQLALADPPAPGSTRALFGGVVLPLADQLTVASRDQLAPLMTQLWADALGEAVPDADALARRYGRIREGGPVAGAPRRIAVLSRVTVGADIAITSIVLQRVRQRFPAAEIVLLAGRSTAAVLGAMPGLRVVAAPYPRHGTVRGRLDAYEALVRVVADVAPDLLVGPDSRLDQLGSLPLLPEAQTCFLETTHGGAAAPMSRIISDRLDLALGPGHAAPTVWLQDLILLPERRWVAVKLDTGGAPEKGAGLVFERALLRRLHRDGWSILLDRGWGDTELAQTDARLAGWDVPTVAIGDLEGGPGAGALDHLPAEPVVVRFHGTLAGWAGLTHQTRLAVGYDSVHGHLAAAEAVWPDGRRTAGVSTTVVFCGHPTADFAAMWTPTGRDVRVVTNTTDPLELAAAVVP